MSLTDLDDDIHSRLSTAADRLAVPPGDPGAVIARGRRRALRLHRAVAVGTTMALVGITAGALRLAGHDGGTPLTAGAGVSRGPAGITWRHIHPASGLGTAAPVKGAAPLYALSTAPGQADVGKDAPNRVVWRSDDGVEWTAASTLGSDLFLSDLASGSNRVYAVGTGPATAAVGGPGRHPVPDLVVGWSDDGAKTWHKAQLPVDMGAIASRSTGVTVQQSQVAVGQAGVLAVTTVGAQLDVPALLPPGASARDGWATTATGVDLLGPPARPSCPIGTSYDNAGQPPPGPAEVFTYVCTGTGGTPTFLTPQQVRGVTASYTWSQLHIEGDLLQAARRQPFAFVAKPGSTRFERVELPPFGPVDGLLTVQAGDDGFDLVATTGNRGSSAVDTVMLRSSDGRKWVANGPPPGLQYVTAAGRVAGRTVLVGETGKGAVVVVGDEGGWVSTPLARALGPGAAAGTAHVMAAGVGPLGVVAAVAVEAPGTSKAAAAAPQPARLLVSRDATTWSDQAVDDLAGEHVGQVARVLVDARQVVVTAFLPVTGRPGPARQVVLVGTAS